MAQWPPPLGTLVLPHNAWKSLEFNGRLPIAIAIFSALVTTFFKLGESFIESSNPLDGRCSE